MLPLIGGLLLAGAIGFAGGWRLHGGRPWLLLTDTLQGLIGGALASMAYALTGPLQGGVELLLVPLIGAWVWLGVAHLTVAILSWIGARQSE